MTDRSVKHEAGETKGRFVINLGDGSEAELNYSVTGSGNWSANHTGVPPAHEGKGIAGQLVRALVAAAKEADVKIVPRCSYVAAWAQKHPEEAGIFD
ncbi:MAG: N-acetyltransferase [Alphaproteobacteria bacterium]|nr:N-acetyltransferase [Alphaproteobacteria bacterium]